MRDDPALDQKGWMPISLVSCRLGIAAMVGGEQDLFAFGLMMLFALSTDHRL